jgi:integrase
MTSHVHLFDPGSPDPSGITTIADLVAAFLADQKTELSDSTFKDRERIGKRFAAEFGRRPPITLRPSEVKAWIFANPKWQKPTTRWGVLNNVQRIFNWSVLDGQIERNPIKSLRLPLGDPRRSTTEAEFQAMLRASDALFRRPLVFMRAVGCRPGQMASVEWEWIEWDLGIIVVPKHKHKAGKRTKKPLVIILTRVAMKLLLWLQKRSDGMGVVFRSRRGHRWSRVGLSKRLDQIRQRTGISPEACFHGIRHLAGSTGIRRGGNLKLISKGMGHASTGVTERFYVHLDVSREDIEAIRAEMELAAKRPGRL